MRICSRGHRNPRGVQFCSECGSADLSTPAPPASFLHHFSGIVLYLFSGLTIALIFVSAVLAALYSIHWTALAPSLVELVLMVGFLYWTTTLLPGPIRKLGKAAGRWAWKSGKTGNNKRNGKH